MKTLYEFICEMVQDNDHNMTEHVKQSETETSINMNGFVVLKPGFMDKEPELRDRLEAAGWEIVGEVTRILTDAEARAFYDEKKNEPYFDDLIEYMCSGECKGLMLWKKEAAKPIEEIQVLKEKFRIEFSDDELKNVLHSPDSFDSMETELNILLSDPVEEQTPEDDSDEINTYDEDFDDKSHVEDTGEAAEDKGDETSIE